MGRILRAKYELSTIDKDGKVYTKKGSLDSDFDEPDTRNNFAEIFYSTIDWFVLRLFNKHESKLEEMISLTFKLEDIEIS